MPIRTKISLFDDSVQAAALRQRLAEEFQHPQEKEPEPIIVEDRGVVGGLRLYVIWRAWDGLSQRERSEVIAEAYRDAHQTKVSLPLLLAVGLTPDEAQNMGLKYA